VGHGPSLDLLRRDPRWSKIRANPANVRLAELAASSSDKLASQPLIPRLLEPRSQ
jgi:hypothetical protein